MDKNNNDVFYYKGGKLCHYKKSDINNDNKVSLKEAVKEVYSKTKRKRLKLPYKEYSMLVHEINNWYHHRYENKRTIKTCINSYEYTVINNGFSYYEVIRKKSIKVRKRKRK